MLGKNRKTSRALVGAMLVLACMSCAFWLPQSAAQNGLLPLMPIKKAGGPPKRVVSVAPAITEILFSIGAGDSVKGVTDYCYYPEEAQRIKKIGGFYNLNFEAILALSPDLVILLPSHQEQRLRFQRMQIPTYTIDLNTLTGIMSSTVMLGLIFEKELQANMVARSFQQAMVDNRVRSTQPRKTVMLVIDRDYARSGIEEVYIAGKGDFYDEMIHLAGGKNVFTKEFPKYPKLSHEGLLSLDPDIIIELIPDPQNIKRPLSDMKNDWEQLSGLKAYQQKTIFQLTGDYLVIPGPRLIQMVDKIKECLAPKSR